MAGLPGDLSGEALAKSEALVPTLRQAQDKLRTSIDELREAWSARHSSFGATAGPARRSLVRSLGGPPSSIVLGYDIEF